MLDNIVIIKQPLNKFSIEEFIISLIDSSLMECFGNILDLINTFGA